MATNFPSSLDTLTNPTVSDYLNSTTVPHATQHADLNDAVEALEAKVGVDSSAVATSLDYKVAALEAGATASAFVVYADVAARTAGNPSPSEGDVAYMLDTNKLVIFDGSVWADAVSL